LLICADALFGFGSIHAFSMRTNYSSARTRNPRSNQTPIIYSNLQVNDDTNGMSKIETAGVKSFTITYDKLCKACPTRLEPRVDTLTEMILGLPDEEREELMANIAMRLEERKEFEPKVQSSKDVYDFQTAGISVKPEKQFESKKTSNGETMPSPRPAKVRKEVDANAKLLKEIDKARIKIEYSKQRAARARRLLAVTNALLARNAHANEPTIYQTANPVDNGWYHEIDDLRQLSRAELKMEKLKFNAQKAKYESKVAKGRLKLYGASRSLAVV
jgi:hypothetical protein